MSLLTRREFINLLGRSALLVPAAPALSAFAGSDPENSHVQFIVNGRPVIYGNSREAGLLDFLRTDLNLKGTKYGCGVGACGACTVLINNKPVRSCVVNVRHLKGMSVRTIEDLGGLGALEPIQKTFSDLGVFQCGYCAPGFVMTARSLLAATPDPSVEQIREAFWGNLCRCTGYQKIINAVQAVNNPELKRYLEKKPCSGLGCSPVDVLSEMKVTGGLAYAGDHDFNNCLTAKVVWSEAAHAFIEKIDITEAEKMPGVVRILTHRDIPGRKTFGSIFPDQPVLAADKVKCHGEAVAVVVAETREAALAGAGGVKVYYREIPGVFSPDEALAPGAPQLTDKGNVCCRTEMTKGSIETGRKRAAAIVKGVYKTPCIEHAYLETESCLIRISEDGRMEVTTASQAPHGFQEQIAAILDLPKDRIRINTTLAGGAFGGKGDLTVQHLCALASFTTGRPVRIDLTRDESIRVSVKRHPFTLKYETGADAQGRLTHCVVEGWADAGAYHSASMVVIEDAAIFATGPYQIDNINVGITGVFTNNPVCGAMRGFGTPQVCLAMERQIDELAHQLNMDPLEFRLINALDEGKVSQWGQVMGQGVGIKACLEALKKTAPRNMDKFKLEPNEKPGLGYAACYKNASTPTFLPFGKADVKYSLNRRGRIVIHVGSCELGQGLVTVLARIGSEELGLPADMFEIVFGSTDKTSSPVLTTSSQATFLTGGAVADGLPGFRRHLIESASKLSGIDGQDLDLDSKGIVSNQSDEIVISYNELAWRAGLAGLDLSYSHQYTPDVVNIELPKRVETIGPEQRILPSLGYGAQAALVAVNELTGAVRIIKIFAAHDVGRVINPAGVEGQIEGGVVMGLGWCLKESLKIDKGRIITDNLDTYFIPRTKDIPEIEALIVEVPDPASPTGAKGVGELSLVPTAPAVLNAIRDAVGKSLNEIPISEAEIKKRITGNKV